MMAPQSRCSRAWEPDADWTAAAAPAKPVAKLSDPALAWQMPGARVALSRRKQGFESLGSANDFSSLAPKTERFWPASPTFLQWTGAASDDRFEVTL